MISSPVRVSNPISNRKPPLMRRVVPDVLKGVGFADLVAAVNDYAMQKFLAWAFTKELCSIGYGKVILTIHDYRLKNVEIDLNQVPPPEEQDAIAWKQG